MTDYQEIHPVEKYSTNLKVIMKMHRSGCKTQLKYKTTSTSIARTNKKLEKKNHLVQSSQQPECLNKRSTFLK